MQQQLLKSFLLALSSSLTGPIYVPEDADYATEIAAYNTAVQHTPEVVVGAASTQDVVDSVRLARQHGYSVAVQTTGHGALEPIVSGVLLTTRRMDEVSIDAEKCIATIAGGVKWKSVIEAAAQHGLAPITGSSTGVGVVGYLLGGGVGPLARSHGFSSDYIIGLSVVTGSGELVEASETQNSELFWALRGGKVGFGIVTEVRLRLVQLKTLYAGALFFEEKDIEAALRAWADWTAQADAHVTTSIAIIRFPAFAAIPEMFRGRRLLALRFAYPGSIADGMRLAAPLRSCAPVYFDALGELPAAEVERIHNDPKDPMPFWASTVLLKGINQDVVSVVLEEIGAGRETPFNALEIRHIGGAARCDVKAGSAVGGRAAEFAIGLVGRDPKQFEGIFTARGDQFFHALRPWIAEEGNINLMGKSIEGKHFATMWASDILKRLVEVQRRYDPDGVFNPRFR